MLSNNCIQCSTHTGNRILVATSQTENDFRHKKSNETQKGMVGYRVTINFAFVEEPLGGVISETLLVVMVRVDLIIITTIGWRFLPRKILDAGRVMISQLNPKRVALSLVIM